MCITIYSWKYQQGPNFKTNNTSFRRFQTTLKESNAQTTLLHVFSNSQIISSEMDEYPTCTQLFQENCIHDDAFHSKL